LLNTNKYLVCCILDLIFTFLYIFQSGTKGWQDGSKLPGHTLGNLTPADRHGSVQVI